MLGWLWLGTYLWLYLFYQAEIFPDYKSRPLTLYYGFFLRKLAGAVLPLERERME